MFLLTIVLVFLFCVCFSCFLAWEPSLGAFYGPVGLLILITLFFFTCTSCVVRGSSDRSPEMEAMNEIELTNDEGESVIAPTHVTTASTGSSVLDKEYRPVNQLRALAVVLFLFIIVWATGACVVAKPFAAWIPYQEKIFSYVYGVISSTLGLFILIFYCLGRNDARSIWRRFFCCEQQAVYDVNVNNHVPHANGHIVQSASSLDSSFTNKSSNGRANHLNSVPKKQSNINLVPSQTATLTEPSIGEVQDNFPQFYNTRQNGVAKKFWQKQNKLKRSNVLLHKECNLELAANSGSLNRDSESESRKRGSYGINSDANNHLSIDLQFQSNGQVNGPPSLLGSEHPPAYNSLPRGMLPLNIAEHAEIEENQRPNIDARTSSFGGSQKSIPVPLPQIPPPPGDTHTPLPLPPTAPPLQNGVAHPIMKDYNSLPRLPGKPPKNPEVRPVSLGSECPPQILMEGESHKPQPLDSRGFTRPLSGGSIPQTQTLPTSRHTSPECDQQRPQSQDINGEDQFHFHDPNCNKTDVSEKSRSNRQHNHKNDFIDQLEQRIPPHRHNYNRPLSPAQSDTTQSNDNRLRSHDSDNTSEPSHHSNRRRHRSRDHRKRREIKKQKSLNWDDQFKNQPRRQMPYAYVNHRYNEFVRQKYIHNLSSNGFVDNLSSNSYWFPRSVSAYEQVSSDLLEPDSSSSSSEEDMEGVWVLQKEKKKSNRETSV